MTLKELHDKWSAEPRWRKLAGMTLQASLAVFLREHGDTPVSRCTAAAMSRWLDETQAGASDTVLALSCLRNLFRWAKEQRLASVDPAAIRLDADTFNARPATAPRPAVPSVAGTIKPGNGGRRWPKETAMESRTHGITESRSEGRKTKDEKRKTKPRKSVNPSVRKSAEAIKAVGSRVKRAAEKALRQDFKERFSSKWIGKSIGRVLDHQAEPGNAKMKTGPKGKRGGYTTAQNDARRHATALGYVVGRCEAPDERMRIYVHPETKRSAPRERHWIELGFTLHYPHGTPAAPIERDPHDPATYHLMWRCKKKGYLFDGKRCIIPASQHLDPRTERSLESSGFEIIEN